MFEPIRQKPSIWQMCEGIVEGQIIDLIFCLLAAGDVSNRANEDKIFTTGVVEAVHRDAPPEFGLVGTPITSIQIH